MIKTFLSVLAVISIVMLTPPKTPLYGKTQAASPETRSLSCSPCHSDFATLLHKKHPATKGGSMADCLGCHRLDPAGKSRPNKFSAGLHRAHAGGAGKLECSACHAWKPGVSFGFPGTSRSLGAPTKGDMAFVKPVFASWAGNGYLDSLHGSKDITCAACHGMKFPTKGDSVENSRCLACHVSYEAVARKTVPKDFADRNPHRSHLGEIECSVCHKGHSPSKAYCLDCHKLFKMKIPAEERK